MEEGLSETGDTDELSVRRRKMEGLSLQLASQPTSDLPVTSSTFIDSNNPTLSFPFTAPIHFSLDELSNLSALKEEKDIRLNSQISKMSENSFNDNKNELKVYSDRSELTDMKELSPLHMLAVSAFQEHGQQSPASTSQAGPQVLRYQTSGGGGDAMLSAINYNNDSEMLNESAFEMNSTNTQLDEGIMGNPSQNIRLSEGQGSHTYDLFDGNVNEALSLSPLAETGLIVDEGGIADSNQESNILNEQNQGIAQDTNNGNKKGKKNLPKTQFSPMKQNLVCPTCGKSFNNSSALAKHRLTHSEERKYICNVCHKGFKRQDHLNGHLMTHREKKPYECQEENCEKSYCDARSLRRHLEGHHHQTPEAIAASVLASMNAAGISNNSQSNGKPRASDQRAFQQEATQMLQISSPSYSGNTTPSPSPSYTNTAQTGGKQFFPFDQVQNVQQQQQQQTVVSQPAPKTTTTTQGGNSKQSWQGARNPVYNYVSNPFTGPAPGNSELSSSSGGYSPVSPVPPASNTSASATPHLATHQRQLWFNNTTPADMVKASEDVVKPPVSCTICEKKFKNIPALNGHMRLHGGYMKKEKGDKDDTKKSSKPKTKIVKQPPPRLPSSHQSTAHPSQVQNILPSLVNQGLQILKSPQYSSTGQSVAQSASVQPVSVPAQQPQQLASEQSSNFVRQQHPILQHQLQIHALQQQQQQQQVQASEQQQSLAAQNLQQSQTVNSGNEGQQAELRTIPHPALLQVHGVTPDQILPIHQLDPVQQQLVQQQLQQLTLAAVPNLIQQSIQLPPSLTSQLNPQQLETVQQLQPNHIQQLIQEHHLLQQRQLQEQQQQQASKSEDSSNQMVETQVQAQYEMQQQQQQMLAEQNRALLQQQSLGLQGIQNIDIGQQQQREQDELARQRLQEQQNAQIENMDLNQISQTLLGLQSQGMTLPSSNPSSVSVSYNQRQLDPNATSPFISGNDVHLPQPTQRQDVGMFGSVSEAMPQEGKLSNIQPTLHQLSMSHPVDSSQSTIDSIQRDLMESHPKVVPCVSSSGDSVLRNELLKSQNFRPISASHSEVRRRLSADSERTISPQHSHANLTMLLTKGPQSDKFAKPRTLTEFSPPSGRVRMRSKSGDDHIRSKLMRSKSIDHSFMRPRSQTEDSLYRERHSETVIGRSKSHADDVFSKSAGASVFRNPGILASPVKFKRKHRPAPLFIPPHLNSFQSRLRSPRLWDGSELKGPGHGHTPPPYTPPPMLSPNRRSSGLFCSIQSARPFTPRSAPITPRLLPRKSSISKPEVEEETEDLESEDTTPPPETDTKPHINVGTQFQAVLPQFNPNMKNALRSISREDVMWEPFAMADNTDDEVQYYQDFACCAAVKGNGFNVEYALHLLYMAKGNIQNAILMLMEEPPKLPSYHTLLTYNYQESDSWSTEEIENFHKGLNKFDKDFFNVSKQVGSKNVKQCVQFYYLWKKVCPEDYKRLRIIRRKREQEDLYNLRSRPTDNQNTVSSTSNLTGESGSESSVSDKTEEPMEVSRNSDTGIENSSVASTFSTYTSTIESVVNNTNYTSSTSPGNIPILTVPSPQPTTFTCDHPNCRATFNSKPALSGHRRMHSSSVNKSGDSNSVGGATKPVKPRQPRPKPRSSPGKPSPVLNDLGEEIFPCKLCDRIFSKVKSRSAHMKSHKVAETEKTKSKTVEMIKVAAMVEPDKFP